ncbi:tyrosine-type recombinase/integrase [Pseudarthrobacter sp. NPDC058119]|uniref:tyrosine-type recombinase/integrase n=1 Tax=Pseudarthrobacter sp. NPDC058119 TaxID=3346348 RepID=UPI0036DF9E3F
MSANLTATVADFLAYKRALGRKYLSEEATLNLLIGFAEEHAVTDLAELTPRLLDEFVASRPRERSRSFNHLIGVTGSFLDWAITQQRVDAVHWQGRRRHETDRRLPFLFDPAQARQLLNAAAALPDYSRGRGRSPTYHGIFALCYGLGLRVGEACSLRLEDIDADRQLLIVHGGKFGKSRFVPFGPRIGELLAGQLQRRHERGGTGPDPLFTFDGRHCVAPCGVSETFRHLTEELAFPVPAGTSAPRLHCLRHSFAVGCLLRWYREGLDPSTKLIQLSTFMGHVSPASTAVYLTITPELLSEASRRFEAFAKPVWSEEKP